MNDVYAVRLTEGIPFRIEAIEKEAGDSVLQFCYRNIDCDIIQTVASEILPEPYVMIVDEEFLLRDRPQLNILGTFLADCTIAGKAVIMKEVETEDGWDFAWLNSDEADSLIEALDQSAEAAFNSARKIIKNAR